MRKCTQLRGTVEEANIWQLSRRWNDVTRQQCTYNVTLRRFRVTIVAVEKQ
jgi:hypothetical protein